MIEALDDFLKRRAERAFRNLVREASEVTAAEAVCDRKANWPSQRWGIGQDGSIAGIVVHVIAWKRLTLSALRGDDATPMSGGKPDTPVDPSDWSNLLAELRQAGGEWNRGLYEMHGSAFEREVVFEGAKIPVVDFVSELIEHDIQHASQIEYLRQLHRAEDAERR